MLSWLTQDSLFYIVIIFIIAICLYMYYVDRDALDLKCVVSNVDGNTYCVRDRKKVNDAADLLARVTVNCKKLVEYVGQKHPDREDVQRLVKGFNPQKVMETLPTSAYTAYSENKGAKIAFCLNPKKNKNEDNLIDEHTLTFVAIHELAHVGTKSIGHKSEFWENFKFLLENAKEAGIHEPRNYKESPKEYCSMKIKDNPYYDM
jgi:hypothetical protein